MDMFEQKFEEQKGQRRRWPEQIEIVILDIMAYMCYNISSYH